MYAYLLQINQPHAQGHQVFHTKVEALRAFDRAFSIGGSVTLHQGAFARTPSGYVRQHGRAFLVAREDFDDEGQVI